MVLKEVTNKDSLFKTEDKYDVNSNRFALFDEEGNEINDWELRQIPNFKDLEVIETTMSFYEGYGVGFDVTHVKLKVAHLNLQLTNKNFKFGQSDTRG